MQNKLQNKIYFITLFNHVIIYRLNITTITLLLFLLLSFQPFIIFFIIMEIVRLSSSPYYFYSVPQFTLQSIIERLSLHVIILPCNHIRNTYLFRSYSQTLTFDRVFERAFGISRGTFMTLTIFSSTLTWHGFGASPEVH